MAPRELLATHTSRDLSEWEAYFHVLAVEAQGTPGRARASADRRQALRQAQDERGTPEELERIFDQVTASA